MISFALRAVFGVGLLNTLLLAQEPERPVPGAQPGTERWIVTFRERPFDLSTYREARRDPHVAAEAADAVVRDLERRAVEHQRAILAEPVAVLGGRITQHWWLIDGCAVEVPAGRAQALAAVPGVAGLFPDGHRRMGILRATDALNHATDVVHQVGIRGAGVTIAVPDSGFDVVDASRATPGPNPTFYVDGNVNNTSGGGLQGSRLVLVRQMGVIPIDVVDEHGTAVAAVAAGETWNQTPESDAGQAPRASIAAYAWSDTPTGLALVTVMISTWQQIAVDALTHGIRVASMSYEGSAPPQWPDQQAIDALVLNADVFVAAMAGNTSGSTHYSHGATNAVAVGSVGTDTRRVSTFSSRGPLEVTLRPYPDLVANGELVTTPLADGGNRTASGTSYAAPQVAGAAALYRSVRPAASALEVRAALFATAQDVSESNPNPPFATRNAYGLGYLRTDRLIAVASGQGTAWNGILTPGTSAVDHFWFVQGGRAYAAGAAWNRHDLTRVAQSDVDLDVVFQGQVIASASERGPTYERVTFRPPASGFVTLRLRVNAVETAQVPYALVATEATQPWRAPRAVSFGRGCGPVPPQLIAGGSAVLGRRLDLSVPNASYPGLALLLGLSNRTWAGAPLPIDLGPLGAPGCSWLVSLEAMLPLGPAQALTVFLPLDHALLGAQFYVQAWAPAPGANPANLALSNGLDLRIGGQ